MNIEDIALKLQETADRSLRNEGRIKKLEDEHEVLHELATAVAVMAEQIKTMSSNVNVLSCKVDKLEETPAKRWDSLVEKAIWAVCAAFIGYVLSNIGL